MALKMNWTDLAAECCPEVWDEKDLDRETAERIRSRVMEKSGVAPRNSADWRRRFGVTILAAALVLAFTVTAFATGLLPPGMRKVDPGEQITGSWTVHCPDGTELEQTMSYPDAGYVFRYEGEAADAVRVLFRVGWTPWDPEGREVFTNTFNREWDEERNPDKIPLIINIHYYIPGFTWVLDGPCELVKEETWEKYRVWEISVNWTPDTLSEQHYVLLFDDEGGYMISVAGTEDYETLERVAKSLEIMETNRPVETSLDENVGILNIGRG